MMSNNVHCYSEGTQYGIFTAIKRFVYISVIIQLNFENPKLDKF